MTGACWWTSFGVIGALVALPLTFPRFPIAENKVNKRRESKREEEREGKRRGGEERMEGRGIPLTSVATLAFQSASSVKG